MKANYAFTGFYTQSPFWYRHFGLRENRKLIGGQSIEVFDAADIFCFWVTTMKAMKFQDDILSIPSENFKDQYELVFDLTPMKDDTENCLYSELVDEPLRMDLSFTFPLKQLTELIV